MGTSTGHAPLAPQPPGRLVTGHLRRRYADPLGLFADSRALLGDVVRYRMAFVHVEQFTHPEQVGQVLVDADDVFAKGTTWAKTRPLIGEGLVTSEGDVWRRQRRQAQPVFHRDRLAGLSTVLTETITEHLDGWSEAVGPSGAAPLPVFPAARRLTLDLVIRALFGLDLGRLAAPAAEAFPVALEVTDTRLASPWPYTPRLYRVPTPGNRRFGTARVRLDAVVTELIGRRRTRLESEAEPPTDLLGPLITTATDEPSDRLLRDQVMTLLLAGFETAATTICWALQLLVAHPEQAAVAVDEVDRALDGRAPTAADLGRLPRLRAVVDETLRLYPPVWAIPRMARRDTELGGYRIPAGDLVIVVPWVTHRHPDFWPEPAAFRPDRFDAESRPTRYAYLPFGGGRRRCIGQQLALTEVVFALAMIVQRFRLPAPTAPVDPDPYVTLRPRGDVPLLLGRR